MMTINLTRGLEALVDDEDYQHLSSFKWMAISCRHLNYAGRSGPRKPGQHRGVILMHRVILGVSTDYNVDHINRDGLDNRRANLRVCDHSLNMANRRKWRMDGYKGVHLMRAGSGRLIRDRWTSAIRVHGKSVHLGSFDTEIEAALAYDKAAAEAFGEFAVLNFPPSRLSAA